MLTPKEKSAEFWMLVKGILQDEKVDTDEARVIKRWLEEHQTGTEFALMIKRLDDFLRDGWIGADESKHLCASIGTVLATLRHAANA